MVKQFMEAAQQDGEQDRIRIMQAEDEILCLQAELDETLVEMEYNQQMVDRLSSELDTVKNAYNLDVDEFRESKSEGERKLLLDNVEHFESLRDNLEKSLSEKMEVVYACKKEVSDTQELLDSFKTKNEEIVKGEEACHTVRVTARAPEPSAEDPARGQDQAGEYQH
jgi:hypothetical protein